MIDTNSNTWEEIKKWANSQVASLRNELEEKGLSEIDTEYLRGQVSAIRGLMKLGADDESAPIVSTEYFD